MMLKTSSRNVNPFFGMLRFTLRKNIGIIIVVTIAALLFCPGHYLIDLEQYINRFNISRYSGYDMLQDFMYIVSVVSGILVTFFNFINFSYMYQKRSSDVFHAFPLTRTELLLSRLLSSVIGTLIPATIAYIAYTAMCIFNPWMMASLSQILISYLHTLLVILVCSSFSAVFVVSAGSMFDLGLSFIGGNVALLVIAAIIDMILEETLLGYVGNNSHAIMKVLSPLYYSGMGLANLDNIGLYGISKLTVRYIITSVVYTAVFTAASLLLYNRRKAERGGQAYAFKYIYIICSILAGICGGYIVGYIFASSDFNIIFWIFSTIGAILTCVVYGAITNRGFKNFKSSIVIGAISALVLPSVALAGITGCFGYSKHIPDADKVQSASIGYFSESIEFDDKNVDWVRDYHSRILKSDALIARRNLTNEETRWIYLNYYMKDGTTVTRRFHIVQNRAKDILLELYKREERMKTVINQLNIDMPQEIDVSFTREDSTHASMKLDKEQFLDLLDCYKQDLKNADEGYIDDNQTNFIHFEWRTAKEYTYQYYTFDFSKKFTNLYNFLDSKGMFLVQSEDGQSLVKK